MKHFTFIFLGICLTLQSLGQNEVYLGFSQTFSSFRYTNSESEKDAFVDSDVKAGSMVGYNVNFQNWMDLKFDLSFLNIGARANYENYLVKWELNYLNANVNFGYRYKKSKFQPYINMGPYVSYLYKGSQEINSVYYDLVSLSKIKRIDFGATVLYGLNMNFSPTFNLFVESRHTFGLNQIEKDDSNQKLYNRALSIFLGIKVTLNHTSK